MKKEFLNGERIPYEKNINELKDLLSSPNMKNFSLACEALSYSEDPEAYELLKSFIDSKDKYRKLYILKTIFRIPQSIELIPRLEEALCSDNMLFTKAALNVISDNKVKVSEELLCSTVAKHINKLDYEVYALYKLDICNTNYIYLTELFKCTDKNTAREIICDILTERYLPDKARDLFELFGQDKYAKIRLAAVKIAKKHSFDISEFLSDIDGHVRKFASRPEINLSFLSEYTSSFTVDISDDLNSAVIYNPFGGDNIYVEYFSDDEYDPFMVRFSYQHVHLPDESSAKEWIDRVTSGELFAIEFFKDGRDCFGGEIEKEDIDSLSYDILEQYLNRCGLSLQNISADSFKIRGWNPKSAVDFVLHKDNGIISVEKI